MAAKEEHIKALLTTEKRKLINELKLLLINSKESEVVKFLKELLPKDRYILNLSLDKPVGYYFIHLAAINHLEKCITALIENGAKPRKKNNHGYTYLHLLLESKHYYNSSEKHTFKKGDPELQAQEAQKRKAIIFSAPITVINETDKQGKTPLHFALRNKLIEDAQWLIEAGAIVMSDDIPYAQKELKLGEEHSLIKLMKRKLEVSTSPSREVESTKQETIKQETTAKIGVPNTSASFFPKSTTLPVSRERAKTVSAIQKPKLPVSKSSQAQVQNRIDLFEKKSAEQGSRSYKKN